MDINALLDKLNGLTEKLLGEAFINKTPCGPSDGSVEGDLACYFAKVEDGELAILGGSKEYPPSMFSLTEARSGYERSIWDEVMAGEDDRGDWDPKFTPIAADGGGNNIMISINPGQSDHGTLFDWDHETREAKAFASSLKNHIKATVDHLENKTWMVNPDGELDINPSPGSVTPDPADPVDLVDPAEPVGPANNTELAQEASISVTVHQEPTPAEKPTMQDWGVLFGKIGKAAKVGAEAAKKAWEDQAVKPDDKPDAK